LRFRVGEILDIFYTLIGKIGGDKIFLVDLIEILVLIIDQGCLCITLVKKI
jgi:hypothetical protein